MSIFRCKRYLDNSSEIHTCREESDEGDAVRHDCDTRKQTQLPQLDHIGVKSEDEEQTLEQCLTDESVPQSGCLCHQILRVTLSSLPLHDGFGDGSTLFPVEEEQNGGKAEPKDVGFIGYEQKNKTGVTQKVQEEVHSHVEQRVKASLKACHCRFRETGYL